MPELGMLVATCDAHSKHFDRVLGEFARLRIPFAVNFDHCCDDTKRFFKASPYYIGGLENDDPANLFDESHRQGGLDVLVAANRFDWAGYLDTDETFSPKVKRVHVNKMLTDCKHLDLIDTPLIDLWGDANHYRDDGPFKNSHRERFYNLRSGKWRYTTAVVHAPKLFKEQTVEMPDPRAYKVQWELYPMYFMHYGIMNQADCQFHIDQWNRIYTNKVGNNPYGFYDWIADPIKNPPIVHPVSNLLGRQ